MRRAFYAFEKRKKKFKLIFLFLFSVLDASTKLPDGILAGNTFQMGHFDECLSVAVTLPEENRMLKGQYCLAEMEYSPRNTEVYTDTSNSNELDLFNTSVWSHIKVMIETRFFFFKN